MMNFAGDGFLFPKEREIGMKIHKFGKERCTWMEKYAAISGLGLLWISF